MTITIQTTSMQTILMDSFQGLRKGKRVVDTPLKEQVYRNTRTHYEYNQGLLEDGNSSSINMSNIAGLGQ
jgi:hypothetical protein